MVDEVEPEAESDLRRRAAWLLGALAIAAVLFIVVLTTVIHTKNGDKHNAPGPLDGEATSHTSPPPSTPDSQPVHTKAQPVSHHTSTSASPVSHHQSCPTAKTCILDGDVGDGLTAINAYRTAHGKPAVPGAVTPAAQTCAVNNGNGCSGGWAETEVPKPDGAAAVAKILQFAQLLDPNVKNFEIGWAYDPGAKLYYFAVIRDE